MSENLANDIRNKALELGYDDCGIISTASMKGYAEKLSARIERFPDCEPKMKYFYNFASPEQKFPWAKSVVICVRHYGKYKIPKSVSGLIGKYYLTDGRQNPEAESFHATDLFSEFLREQGLETATERKFGITALRWAAMQAGLGIIRKNNFFYTEKGSWVYLEAWLIDKELELTSKCSLPPCPDSCGRCVDACPTKSLAEPYFMNRGSCISCITTWDGRDMPNEKYRKQLGQWVFGCDACQDVCPHNKNKWRDDEDFPGLDKLADKISLKKIVKMDYDFLRDEIHPKFWYIGKDDVWKWKTNAINAMINDDVSKYREDIAAACGDPHEKVREMAELAEGAISLTFPLPEK